MNTMNLNSKVVLNNKVEMPIIGFGVFRIPDGEEVYSAVKTALGVGYRYIDTAMIYKNEAGVGKAIADSNLQREDIFITTKLWNTDQGYETTLRAIDSSLERLGLSYVDLYLVHWPTASGDRGNFTSINKRSDTWRAMEEIYKSGKAKAIGVSNYMINHLEEMKSYAKVMPAVNQFEFHPFLYQEELLNYCKKNNIAVQAHSPLANNKGNDNESVKKIAEKYNKSPSQIFIRWSLQHGAVPIPKSVHKERIVDNINVFGFEIPEEDTMTLDDLNQNFRVRADPTNLK